MGECCGAEREMCVCVCVIERKSVCARPVMYASVTRKYQRREHLVKREERRRGARFCISKLAQNNKPKG